MRNPFRRLYVLLFLFLPLALEAPGIANELDVLSNQQITALESAEPSSTAQSLPQILIVGLKVEDRIVVDSTTVRGAEDGLKAIDFDQWEIPFSDIVKALQLSVETLENDIWEVRSRGFVKRLQPSELTVDAEIGSVLSVAEIRDTFGVEVEFDIESYAIQFKTSWFDLNTQTEAQEETSIDTEGLPLVRPTSVNASALSQSITITGRTGDGDRHSNFNAQGTLIGIGSAFGGSVFTRIDQTSLTDRSSWSLGELQYLRQTTQQDYVLGSQSPFWRSPRQRGQYWGVTTVQRFGFEPVESGGSAGFSPNQRLQSEHVGRSVAGEAEPGTLVQLVLGTEERVVDEVVVDSSRLYRFEDIPTGTGLDNRYQILRYPNGLLTESPEIESATFTVLPGQIPKDASALIVSGGFEQVSNRQSLNRFEQFRGGVGYRRGISEALTLGAGVVIEQTPLLMADAFYTHPRWPLQTAISAVVDTHSGRSDVIANLQFKPSPDWAIKFDSDSLSQRFSTTWQVTPKLSLNASGNTRDKAIAGGANIFLNNKKFIFRGRATLDTQSRFRWNLAARSGSISFSNNGSEVSTQSALLWNLSGRSAGSSGHVLSLNYDTHRSDGGSNQYGSLLWNYRPTNRTHDGATPWSVSVGYGTGSSGDGLIAATTLSVLPGIDLNLRYQGSSASSSQDTYSIELTPKIHLQGLQLASRQQDNLRNQGGLLLQPFFDLNSNGVRDSDEVLLRNKEDLDLLLQVNHQPLQKYRPEITEEGIYITMSPGTHRLDLDPSGQPLNWNVPDNAYALNTVAGQYTPVRIGLVPSYTVLGTLKVDKYNSASGQRIEIIHRELGHRSFSITNGAGTFYIDGLTQGEYYFEVNGQPIADFTLSLDEQSEPLQEINLQVESVAAISTDS